ncbi:SDR family NAD(P)-dependent oxidoreductase [Streptomyces sp. NPDC092296]|uniref:SDR family NAD(P)-dependent oxidoreductase n=1 Tax=Streptomyces sp. NPDC092296 TaxID=3366012 RepID=UPI003825DAD3
MTDHHRILVTGAASGIGAAVCDAAERDGFAVAGLDRAGRPGGRGPAGAGGRFFTTADVTDAAAVRTAFAAAAEALGGPITGLVHCAGVYEPGGPTASLPAESWARTLAVNATGAFLVVREFGRRLIGAGVGGSAVLLSSMASRRGDRAAPAADYGASKGALESLARGLALEWGPAGIRVNVVRPGVIDTPMLKLKDDPEAAAAYLSGSVPLGRFGRASEVADACLFLAGDRASYITGAVLDVDGGVLAG